jgi:hypothetical protein
MGRATTKPEPDTPEITVFSLKLEKQKLQRFKAVADSHERSMAQQLRWLIDREVREFEANGEAA